MTGCKKLLTEAPSIDGHSGDPSSVSLIYEGRVVTNFRNFMSIYWLAFFFFLLPLPDTIGRAGGLVSFLCTSGSM
ncbi:hypothetical protein XELAEV_18000676mg [Xenopus laevis]|nr:hypothetical protein XELAEV_18000676mg [Xenopus laevis]